ncbi:hypothetical protein [Companilactobacillus jidongensis]|uniref:hypothetical protein n=1 Tax=Companilactobacillus jidongensis TaxID=2486006 RepID=UPI000F77D7F9|nr:hypothetical protein [Companilactobacillus jidongensis]
MHDLIQLRETVPAAKHDKELRLLSDRILREISYGSTSFKKRLSFKLNDEELASLDAANVGVSLTDEESESFVYYFFIS